MTVALFIEQIINGIILGSMYALLGSGLALIYGTMRILNFAHGEFFMLAGYFVFFLLDQYTVAPVFAILAATLLVFLIAVLTQRISIHYLIQREGWTFSTIAFTLGLGIFLQNLALLLWGERFRVISYYVKGIFKLGDFRMPYMRLLILGVAIVVLILMGILIKYTRFGMAVRATSQDKDAASVMGIPVHIVHMLTFGLGGAMSAIASALLAPIYAVNPWMGVPSMMKAFVVVILGGLGSFVGAIVAGFMLGIVEAVGMALTSTEWRDVISFSMLILIIWVRPWGLFGVKDR